MTCLFYTWLPLVMYEWPSFDGNFGVMRSRLIVWTPYCPQSVQPQLPWLYWYPEHGEYC
jgi:hypothetical protein